jgi:dolichyl-phosphate-mannose-protein mannosyltransferase
MNKLLDFFEKYLVIVYLLFVICFAFLTFFSNYFYPNSSIWDEVYHISSAQKYISGTYFMEAHPPLGKQIIALGEKIVNPNDKYDNLNFFAKWCLSNTPAIYEYQVEENGSNKTITENSKTNEKGEKIPLTLLDIRQKNPDKSVDQSGFNQTDSIKEFPKDFSFCGYRLLPVIFAILIAPLFFLLLLIVTKNPHLSILGSSLYVFDNAIIAHFRSAMLESIQMFFVVLAVLVTTYYINLKSNFQAKTIINKIIYNQWFKYIILGIVIGLALAVKHNSIILLLLPVILLVADYIQNKIIIYSTSKLNFVIKIIFISIQRLIISFVFAGLIYFLIFCLHFVLANNLISQGQNNQGKYQASEQYLQILNDKRGFVSLFGLSKNQEGTFPQYTPNAYIMFMDNWNYMNNYHNGVPKLDYTKADENGSYPTNWPVMNRTISYRWETSDSNKTFRYIYLIGNPLIWLLALVGVVLSSALVLGNLFFNLKIKNYKLFGIICIFTLLYYIYMGIMINTISIRVMYLYHYFIPLIFSFVLLVSVLQYIFEDEFKDTNFDLNINNKTFRLYTILITVVFLIAFCFAYFSPFTYSQPLNVYDFQNRNWFDFWQMRPGPYK